MPKFKVWNDNDHPHTEMFKGDKITILPKKYVVMQEDDAVMFRGQFYPPVLDGDGQALPTSYKKIRIELHDDGAVVEEVSEPKHICQACKYEADSAKDLLEHVNVTHKDALIVDEEAEKEIKKRGRPAKAR